MIGASVGCSSVSIFTPSEFILCWRLIVLVRSLEASSNTPVSNSSACLDNEDSCLIRLANDPLVTHSNSLTIFILAAAAALAANPCPVAAAKALIRGFISPGGSGNVDLAMLTGSITRC